MQDAVEIQGQQDAAEYARNGADDADQAALHHEHLHHLARSQAEGPQDRDVGLLVGDQHHLRRHQVERAHRDDQRQQDRHHRLLHLQRAEQVGVVLGPVTDPVRTLELQRQRASHVEGLVHVMQLQAHAGHALAHPQQALQVLQVDHRQALVEFVVAGLEHAADLEALHGLHATHRRAAEIGQGDDHVVADTHAQPHGQLTPQHDVEAALREIGQLALDHLLAEHGDLGFLGGHHPAQHRRLVVAAGDQRFLVDVGGCAGNAWILQRDVDGALPVLQRFAITADGGVRGHLQHAVADLALESAHDGQRGDQCGHAQRDAEDRSQRDEGDEAVAAFGAQVAQADGDGDGFEHR